MKPSSVSRPSSNPFATRFISPGQVDWIGADDYFEQLASRFFQLNGRASIIGVHGSGKSTLLEHFVPRIGDVIFRRDAEGNVVDNRSSGVSGKERCPAVWLQLRKTVPESTAIPWDKLRRGRLLVLDGYEQLSLWRRAALIAGTGLRSVKLLVTSHRRTVLPTLCELSITPRVALKIVSQLTTGRGDFEPISDMVVQQCLQEHGGNMREVLMDLYDRVEEQRAGGMQPVKPNS
jgi:hypothetical protein